jgi:GDP-4-dehydro-6-deoxy-D-mannose reductase
MSQRILLTGAAGFVGLHMLAALRAAFPTAQLIAATRPQDSDGRILTHADAVVAFDLLDSPGIAACVARTAPDACVHLAAMADVGASFGQAELVWRANVDGTRALATALMEAPGAPVLIHASSAEVYGLSFRAPLALDEMALLQPANPYAAAKAASDVALGEMALRGLRVVRMRPLNHVGPGQSPRFAVAAFARQVARIAAGQQAPVIRAGALNKARDFLDVRDVCAAYVAALRMAPSLPAGSVFNLASGTPRLMSAVLDDLLRVAEVSAQVETEPAVLRPLDLDRTSCRADAARAQLGWAPAISWDATVADVMAYWLAAEA